MRAAHTILLACLLTASAGPQGGARPVRVAVLDFGGGEAGRRAALELASLLSEGGRVETADPAQARAAARGAGYAGSLNMTVDEARDLGAAVGSDFLVLGDAQTIRRTSSASPVYFEAYASVFVVSSRTGRLVMWDRTHAEGRSPEEAERLLASKLPARAEAYREAVLRAAREEPAEVEREMTGELLEVGEEESGEAAGADGYRPPHPYRRLRPAYTDAAAAAEAEATVDVSVDVDERGEVGRVRVVRWGGFGLDESVVSTVKQLHFRPATRAGRPAPVRVLLRYNFRRPSNDARRTNEGQKRLGPAFKAILNKEP